MNETNSSGPTKLELDIKIALDKAKVLEKFLGFPPSHQREYYKYISEAKKPETRARRINKVVEMLKQSQ